MDDYSCTVLAFAVSAEPCGRLRCPHDARRDLAKQYEKKLEQLKREEELIREEQRELAEALPHDDPDAAKGLVCYTAMD